MFRTLRWSAAALVSAAILSACGGSSANAPAGSTGGSTSTASGPTTTAAQAAATKPLSGHTTVTIRNFMFSPMHLTVKAGTKVSFHNFDQTNHTATALNQSFDTNTIGPDKTVTLTFKKPGTYKYDCLFHAFMTASITVVPQ